MRTDDRRRLKEQRNIAITRMTELNGNAERETRTFTRDEQREWDEHEAELRSINLALEAAGDAPRSGSASMLPGDGLSEADHSMLLGPAQRMTDWALERRSGHGSLSRKEVEGFSLGRAIRGRLMGKWEGAELEYRALGEGTDSAGGFLTPETLASKIIDKVRPSARVLEAGAVVLPLDSDKMSLPRLTTGVTGAWRAEHGAVSEEDPAFDRVTFQPKSLAVAVRLSYELVEDMIEGGAQLIENELIQRLALKVDAAALRGTGTSNEPTGVRNQTGVTIQSVGANGLTGAYSQIMTALGTIMGNNHTPGRPIATPRTYMQLAGLTDTTNQPLNPPKPVADVWPPLITNQIPNNLTQGTSTDTSEVYVGEWENLVIGIKPFVRINFQRTDQGPVRVNLKASDELAMLFQQYIVMATVRADVQLLHPEAFTVVTGVRP